MLANITVVIPVKNEEKNLPACLSRLEGFGPVLVVDSGSTDATCAIAGAHEAEVLRFEWNGRFPKKRNWVLRTFDFKTDWVLFLDADEFVTEAFKAELTDALEGTDKVGFWLNYDRWFLGKRLRHGDEFNKLALFRVGAGEYERIEEDHWSQLDMEIHEHPVLDGPLGEIRAPIEHNEYRGLHHYLAKHNEYASWEANRYWQLMADAGGRAGGGDLPVRRSLKSVGGRPEVDGSTGSEPSPVSGLNSSPSPRLTARQRRKYAHLAKWWAAPAYFFRGYVLKRGFLDGAVGFHFAFCKAVYFYQIRLKIKEAERGRELSG